MKTIKISRPEKFLKGRISLPSSKSISNRLLVMQALSGGGFNILNLSEAEDTKLLQDLLSKISAREGSDEATEINCANAGADLRFLAALLATRPGRWMLTGTDRMKQRPVGDLVEGLKQLGASIEYLGNLGFPPLLIKGRQLASGEIHVNAGLSSQFVSAMLMTGPGLPGGITLHLKGDIVSEPYIDMTVKLMKECGIKVGKWKHKIKVEPGNYSCKHYQVEADWSAASFWYQAAALSDKAELELPGLYEKSLQGDAVLANIFKVLGVHTGFSEPSPNETSSILHPASCIRITGESSHPEGFFYDFTSHPDLALPVIASCAALGIRGRFEGLRTLVIKESDRLRALTHELQKLGSKLELTAGEFPVIEIRPSKLSMNPELVIDTYCDHRMAMTFAMLSLKTGSIRLSDPDVVSKSYPGFWDEMTKAGFKLS